MAYINQQTKKEIMAEVKNILPAEWKATARILDSMKIVLNLKLDAASQTDYENYQNEMASAKTLQAKYESHFYLSHSLSGDKNKSSNHALP